MQFHTNDNTDDAFYVDAGGGSFGLYAVGHTNFVVRPGDTGNAIRMERGWMNLRGSNVWGGAAPAINLSGSASVTLMSGELTVTGGTNTDLVALAGTSSINLRDVFATPRGSGDVVIHIAKPWLLQHDVARYAQLSSLTTVDTQTVQVETNDEIEATWKVTPAYAPGDLIQAVTRKTGVLVDDEELPLMDMNHDARAWGEVTVEGL